MFSKKEVSEIKGAVQFAKEIRNKLKSCDFNVEVDKGGGEINFKNLPKFDKIVEGENRIQLQFNREEQNSPEDLDLSEIVNKNVPFIEAADIKNILKAADKNLGTINEKTHMINNIKFVETGVSKNGLYINILCNPGKVKVNYVEEEKDTIIITTYKNIDSEIETPNFNEEMLDIAYDRAEMDNPFYQSAVEAIKIGAKKLGFNPYIETGNVNGFKLRELPKKMKLTRLYDIAPQIVALLK